MFGVQNETNIRPIGHKTAVPPYDVCKLSYWLRCGTTCCGIDIIVDELLDFKQAHTLPSNRQDAIFKLAYKDFDDDLLLNKTIFPVSDGHEMLRGANNKFYEIEQVDTLLARAQSSVLIAGRQKKVSKIMVCNRVWLKTYYYDPINKNADRLRRILEGNLLAELLGRVLLDDSTNSNTTSVDQGITCDGCGEGNVQGTRFKCTQCKNFYLCAKCYGDGVHNEPHRFQKLTQPGEANAPVVWRTSKHCSHCTGGKGRCVCKEGCSGRAASRCEVVHQGITCDGCKEGCKEGIRGPRYKCAECGDYDLCADCYGRGVHNKRHAFKEILRVGSDAEMLSPRAGPLDTPPTPSSPTSRRSSTPSTAPVTLESSKVSMDSTDCVGVPMAMATPVTPVTFYEGQSVRLTKMTDASRNGQTAKVLKILEDHRVIVQLESEDKKLNCKPEQLEIVEGGLLAVGILVELTGLKEKEARYNCLLAHVVSPPTDGSLAPGHVLVKVLDESNIEFPVMKENCQVIEEA